MTGIDQRAAGSNPNTIGFFHCVLILECPRPAAELRIEPRTHGWVRLRERARTTSYRKFSAFSDHGWSSGDVVIYHLAY